MMQSSIRHRPDIQGLRAVAIALVVLGHAGVPGFPGGFVGVDVFFVLSGYLITGLLVREALADGRIHYGRFLARRLRRLLPAMLTMLVVILLLAPFLLSAYEARMQTGSFAFAATWTSNFFFALSDFDYFVALQTKDLFLHTWSLGVEEQFYIVWPGLIALAVIFGGSRFLVGLMVGVFAASLWLCLYWSDARPLFSFYMMPARGWQFALGALVFILLHKPDHAGSDVPHSGLSPALRTLVGTTGLLLIAASAVMLDSDLNYPSYYALMPSLGAGLAIFAGHGPSVVNRALTNRAVVWIGDRSYSLYLWHWPVLLFADAYGVTSNALGTAAVIAVSAALAAGSYRFVELPFWKGRFSGAVPMRAALFSVFAIVIAVAAANVTKASLYGRTQVAGVADGYDPRQDWPAIYTPGLECDTWFNSAELKPCYAGDLDAKHTAVMLADSVGAQWSSLLPEVFAAPDWRVGVMTKSACAIADLEYFYERIGTTYDICTAWRETALSYIAEIRPDIVFIGSSSHYAFSTDEWTGGVARVVQRLSESAKQVVIIPGTPGLSFNGPSCVEAPYRFSFRLIDSTRECEEAIATPVVYEVSAYLADAAAEFENVHVLNLNDLVCPDGRCAAQQAGGMTVYRDEMHLTETFVMAQIPEFVRRLDRLQIGPSAFATGPE